MRAQDRVTAHDEISSDGRAAVEDSASEMPKSETRRARLSVGIGTSMAASTSMGASVSVNSERVLPRGPSVARPTSSISAGTTSLGATSNAVSSIRGLSSGADRPRNVAPELQKSERLLNEEELRHLLSDVLTGARHLRASLLASLQSPPEPTESLPELFWKLVERRIHGAELSYQRADRQITDVIRASHRGFELTREEFVR